MNTDLRCRVNKNIPLNVKCFDKPEATGTRINDCHVVHTIPVIVFKENQCLVSFKSKDLAFVNEKGISVIFDSMHELSINMNIMQNSAVSFSICMDYNEEKINQLITSLKYQFDIRYNTDLELVTIKNYTEQAIDKYLPKGDILLQQKSRSNYRVLMAKV
jgi:aspartate kinase